MTDSSVLIGTLPEELARRYPHDPAVREAYTIAERHYQGHRHWTGVSLLAHMEGVLRLLLPFRPDVHTVIATLLQHVLHTKVMALDEIDVEFGPGVRSLVSSVHLLSHVTTRKHRGSIEDLRLMLLSVSHDDRVLLIILCERAYVLDHLELVPPPERRKVCRDALGLFSPVAARLGIHNLKQRMESSAFPIVYPNDAQLIHEQFQIIHGRVGNFLPRAAALLKQELAKEGIEAVVEGREKLPYSIFMKMKDKSVTAIEKLHDLFAVRVRVESVEQCYRVLGIFHHRGRPVGNRFKDYIAFPKPNGYQSLHTTVAKLPGVPEGVLLEVQIRTHAMHREAEYGIAAHWSYKEGGTTEQLLRRVQLQQVLTQQQHVQMRRGQHLADHIFVLTPKGDIVELPEGATPLDFAFQIHTHLGLAFRSARVNGVIVPLDYELENGDSVEILTHRVPKPSPEWLQLLKMAASRSRLKRHLYAQNRTEFVVMGREMLNEELRKQHRPPLDTDLTILRRYNGGTLSISEREDILMKLGQGSEKASAILALLPNAEPATVAPRPPRVSRLRRVVAIEVEGGVPMPIRYAKCCKPEEGMAQDIIGVITRVGEVTVHKVGCRMLRYANPERRVGVRWREGMKRKTAQR